MSSPRYAFLLRVFACLIILVAAAVAPAAEPATGFKHRGFYLHEGWLFKHPFAVRSWKREDFAAMYQLLKRLGFDRVMNWPMFESIPAPLSKTDAQAIRDYAGTIDDAHAAGLEFWLAQCANLTPPPSITAKPWKDRNPYPVWKHVRLDDPAEAAAYFAHRRAMMAIANSADAYVTIDGDPGGYGGAQPKEWLSVFLADRATLDACGTGPGKQRLIPWVWCGWGTEKVWDGNPNNPPERIVPFVKPSLEALGDLADLLGGDRAMLVPTWRCLELPLDKLPADLPDRLRKATLSGEAAAFLPGGPRRYLDILAAQVESRRGLLEAVATPAGDDDASAARLAAGAKAMIGWWRIHGYVNDGDENTPFQWRFVRTRDAQTLRSWAQANVMDREAVVAAAARALAAAGILGEEQATKRLAEILPAKP